MFGKWMPRGIVALLGRWGSAGLPAWAEAQGMFADARPTAWLQEAPPGLAACQPQRGARRYVGAPGSPGKVLPLLHGALGRSRGWMLP